VVRRGNSQLPAPARRPALRETQGQVIEAGTEEIYR